MAISFIGATTNNTAGSGSAAVSCTIPGSTAAGDLFIATLAVADYGVIWGDPIGGWFNLKGDYLEESEAKSSLWYKISGYGPLTASVITSSDDTPGEEDDKANDGSMDTKWLCGATTGWIAYQLSSAKCVTKYQITTANDEAPRDPKDWQFQGSHNGTDWDTLATETNQAFPGRKRALTFTANHSTEYLHYRLNVTANNGSATLLQLCEWQLFYTGATDVSLSTTINTGRLHAVSISAYRGVNNSTPITLTENTGWSGTNTAATGSLTPTIPGQWMYSSQAGFDASVVSPGTFTNLDTERCDINGGVGGSSDTIYLSTADSNGAVSVGVARTNTFTCTEALTGESTWAVLLNPNSPSQMGRMVMM